MPTSADDIKRQYPLPAYSYRVTMDEEQAAFRQVSGLRVAYKPVTYRHGLSAWTGSIIQHGTRDPVRLTLQRGVVRARSGLLTWFRAAEAVGGEASARRTVAIDLLDGNGEAAVRWQARGALPLVLAGPTLNAEGDTIAIESLEVIADTLTVEYLE